MDDWGDGVASRGCVRTRMYAGVGAKVGVAEVSTSIRTCDSGLLVLRTLFALGATRGGGRGGGGRGGPGGSRQRLVGGASALQVCLFRGASCFQRRREENRGLGSERGVQGLSADKTDRSVMYARKHVRAAVERGIEVVSARDQSIWRWGRGD
jgi:hypothetical protein